MRLDATPGVRVLRRFLRRKCAAFCAAFRFAFYCPPKVFVGQLQVVLSGHLGTVADPFANDVRRKRFFEFRLPARSQIVEDSRPWLQASPLDDPRELRPYVPPGVAVAGDDMLRSRLGSIPNRFQEWPQFGKQRHESRFMPGMAGGLGASNAQSAVLPIHIVPHNRQVLAGAPQAAISAKGDNQPPLGT